MAKQKSVVSVTERVKLISLDAKYRKTPYQFAVPRSQSKNVPATGQEDVLTEDMMIGKTPIPQTVKADLQMGATPYIINPEQIYPIHHSRVFVNDYDIEYDEEGKELKRTYKNARDHAEFVCFTIGMGSSGGECVIAPNKESYRKGFHYFYIENKEAEAQKGVEEFDKAFEAEKYARSEMGTGRWKDLILLLNFELEGHNLDPDHLSDTRIKEIVLKACRENPDVILKMRSKDSDMTVFILKLIKRNIIQRRKGTDYYYQDVFLGSTPNTIRDWVADQNHAPTVSKWNNMLEVLEPKTQK